MSQMHISRVSIKNFRNFANLDVPLQGDTVLIGENRVGKSNFLLALRLVLDAGLPDTARQLKFSDIWDGCKVSDAPDVRIDVDFKNFEKDTALHALLTDYRVVGDHTTARLTYLFRKRLDVPGAPSSEADYEYLLFGGDDEKNIISNIVRRRICLNLLGALRDAEAELETWRTSPLRPLLENAMQKVTSSDLETIANDLTSARDKLVSLKSIKDLEGELRRGLAEIGGPAQDPKASLGFTPSDPQRLIRAINMYIDDGRRSISDASLGSANLILLSLRLAEFDWRASSNERNFTFLCIEEPEAHLHP